MVRLVPSIHIVARLKLEVKGDLLVQLWLHYTHHVYKVKPNSVLAAKLQDTFVVKSYLALVGFGVYIADGTLKGSERHHWSSKPAIAFKVVRCTSILIAIACIKVPDHDVLCHKGTPVLHQVEVDFITVSKTTLASNVQLMINQLQLISASKDSWICTTDLKMRRMSPRMRLSHNPDKRAVVEGS